MAYVSRVEPLAATTETGHKIMVFKVSKVKKAEQNQNRDFRHHVFNAIFLFTQHSSIFQIIP